MSQNYKFKLINASLNLYFFYQLTCELGFGCGMVSIFLQKKATDISKISVA